MSTSAPAQRIVVIDVLRAFALLGMLITHFAVEFLAGPPPAETFAIVHAPDRYVAALVSLLASGKFFSIFAFLFGMSFMIQLDNAARRGEPFEGRYAWRLLILLAIGCVHQVFFTGDVLMSYALLGLLLIPMRRLSNPALVTLGLLLAFGLPGMILDIAHAIHVPTPADIHAAHEASREFQAMAQRGFEIKAHGTLAELARFNLGEALEFKAAFLFHTGRLWITFGCFLLGMYAARIRLFASSEENRRRLKIVLWSALAIAVTSTALTMIFPPWQVPRHPLRADMEIDAQQASLAAFYVAVVTLWFWRRSGPGFLALLAPMGRMALTSYLLQTAFGVAVFYGIGLGLLGQLGSTLALTSAIAFFVVQLGVARIWLARYSMGPVEWLWRSLTWLRREPLTRPPASPAATA